ncbi:MAG TPA: DUF4292 domain-containing protein [Ignavibacteria bacterium]|nr:DUF4292 domain-containing protein [Ignavibacteria bacterium]
MLIRALLILTAVLFISCTGSQRTGGELDPVSVKDLKGRINKNSTAIETLEASGNISFDSPENSGTGWLELKIKKPDTVFVKIEGPFGISIANALITRTDFTYYNVQDNKVIYGPSTDINIGAILRLKVSFDDLINGFTGSFILNESETDTLNAEVEKNKYLIKNPKTEATEKYYVEPIFYRLNSYYVVNSNDETLIEVNYSDYQEEAVASGKVNFPYNVKIKNPQKSQSVYIEYINKEINKKNISFKMKIPKSAKVIKWN